MPTKSSVLEYLNNQRVTVNGKTGKVMESSDKIKVKFDDGSFGFFEKTEISPVVEDTRLKGNRVFDRMKAEGKLLEHTNLMQPTPTGLDPLSQPVRATGRGPGDASAVPGRVKKAVYASEEPYDFNIFK